MQSEVSGRSSFGLFTYGSLLNPSSACRVLGRSVEVYFPRVLENAAVNWSSPQAVRLVASGDILIANSLNIRLADSDGKSAVGAVIRISKDEIGNLLLRENGYSLIDITHRMTLSAFERVFVFADLRPLVVTEIVMTGYLQRVMDGVAAQGESFAANYRASLPTPSRLVDGEFVFLNETHQRLV